METKKLSAQVNPPLDSSSQYCMRRTPARSWTHKGQHRDNRTVAVLCGCAECKQSLSVIDYDYKKRRKSHGA